MGAPLLVLQTCYSDAKDPIFGNFSLDLSGNEPSAPRACTTTVAPAFVLHILLPPWFVLRGVHFCCHFLRSVAEPSGLGLFWTYICFCQPLNLLLLHYCHHPSLYLASSWILLQYVLRGTHCCSFFPPWSLYKEIKSDLPSFCLPNDLSFASQI